MADISIVVQVVGEKDIIKTTSSLEKMERGVRKLSKDLSTGRIIEKQYNEGLKELRRTVDSSFGSWQKAKGAVDGYAKALKKANIAKEANDNVIALNKMRSTYDRNYAVEQKTLLLKKRLRTAIQDNKMTVREAGAELLRYRKALQQTNNTMQMTKRGTNQLGVMMQQTGYQVGDFAVQVGSGQNVLVAFGQQATQLVGTMAMFAKTTKMIALFSGLGILIPVITGLGSAFFRMKAEADKAAKSVSDLEDRVKGLRDSLKDYKREKLAEGLGITVDQLISKQAVESAKERLAEVKQEYLDKMSSSNPVEVFKFLLDALNPATTGLDTTAEQDAVIEATQLVLDIEKRLAEQQAKRYEDQKNNLDQELALQQKISKFGSDSSKVKALELDQEIASRHRDLEAQRKSLELKGEDVDALKAQVEQILRLEAANEIAAKQKAKDKKTQDENLATLKKALDTRKKELHEANELINANENNLELLRIESKHTKDSVQYRKELVTQEKERLQKLVMSTGLEQWQADIMLSQFETQVGITEKMSDSADKAKDLADALKQASSAMASLSGFSDSLDKKLAVSLAQVQALKSGANSAIAGSIAGMRMDLDKKMSDSISSGVDLGIVERMFGGERERISQYETSENERKRLDGENNKTGGNGKTPKEQLAEYLEGKKQEQILEEKLVGVLDEERQIQTELFNIKNQYAGVITPLQEEELENILRLTEAEKERQAVIEEAQAERLALENSITQAMETGFMAMIDGTMSVKDAFKSMAAAIIKELIQVMVVQKAVAGLQMIFGGGSLFGGASWSANGDVVGSSGIQAYADGGVVGGPTMFQHGGGLGVMGEAGPEAIMPLKRGANGKLGVQMEGSGGGDTYVTNNYSISANTSEDTKRLVTQTIQQATPTITANTKASIMNDRRRGGQMKSVFG